MKKPAKARVRLTPTAPTAIRKIDPAVVGNALGAEPVTLTRAKGSPLSRRAAGSRLLAQLLANEQVVLWAHCVSEHAVIMSPETSLEELQAYHAGEHRGPGTIRNHDPGSRRYCLKKLGEVLSETEENES